MRKTITAALPLLALLAAAAPLDEEALYQARFKDMTGNPSGELSAYAPLEAIKGAPFRPLPVASPATRSITDSALDAAAAYAEANRSTAFIVLQDGKVQTARYFNGTTPTTPLVSKSLAKPITALAVGRAIKLGKIKSLDQPVSDFIPEWKGKPKGGILVRHLLDMRSGLLVQNWSNDPDNPWSRAYLGARHDQYIVDSYPLTDKPGSIYEYNNATAELVARVIEAATGRRYGEFVGTEVLKPIGAAGGMIWVNRPGGLAHSGCCTMLPAETYLRMAKLVLDDGVVNGKRLLPAGYVTAMKTPTAENPHYGLGLWIGARYAERRGFGNPARKLAATLHSEPFAADDLVMFDGNANQIVYIVPSAKLVVLRVGAAPPKSPEWDNTKLPNLILRGFKTPPKITEQPR